jgi:hypothetical protein
MTEKLIKLVFRKAILENNLEKYAQGVAINSNLCDEIKRTLENDTLSNLERARLEVELDKTIWETRIFATNYKTAQRDYQHTVLPIIDTEATEDEKKSIEFKDLTKQAQELAENEIFGKSVKEPANIEHVEMIQNIKSYLSILKNTSKELVRNIMEKSLKLSKLEICKLQKELFDTDVHIKCLEKRLNNRIDYYENQFLPSYKIELAEAKEKLDAYYERGVKIAESGIDVQLQFVLQKYEEHKNNEERIWLYYTALKARVNSIIEEIQSDKVKYKDLQHLTNPI